MKIKTLTWNIGGGKILEKGADPSLIASYNVDAIDYIVDKIKEISPDIISFQEIQKNETYDQAAIIASQLGYDYFVHESFSLSHNEEGAELGNAIISKFPISQQYFEKYINPNVTIKWEDGKIAKTHDKGFVECLVEINNNYISVLTTHLTPFRKFGMNLDSTKAIEILADVSNKIDKSNNNLSIILGDFNIDKPEIIGLLPNLKSKGYKEVITGMATTPKNRRYDHVLYKGLRFKKQIIDNSVLTDHYVIVTEFEI